MDNDTNINLDSVENFEPDDNSPSQESPKKPSWISDVFDYVEIFAFSVCAVIMAFTFFFRVCQVNGNSMFDTLKDKEVIVTSDLGYTPQHGDIITFHETENFNEALVKRVIATEGEWYKIEYVKDVKNQYTKMIVYVSDSPEFDESDIINEDYIDFYKISHFITDGKNADFNNSNDMSYVKPTIVGKVPDGQVFVMGDNRYVSADSRMIGCVDERCILGKVVLRLSPFKVFSGGK